MNWKRLMIAVLAFIVGAGVTWMLISGGTRTNAGRPSEATKASSRKETGLEEVRRRSDMTAPISAVNPERPVLSSYVPPKLDPEERSHLADVLNAPDRTGQGDLTIVLNLFSEYRKRYRGFPVGEDNAAFVNALSGQNPGRFAFIGRDHAAIDTQGQLLDRWGKPYFFHLISRDALEIRSAGPDRELYTADDLVIQSPQAREFDR